MILNSAAITGLVSVLWVSPIQGGFNLVRQVMDILDYGNEKHPADGITAVEHLEAAIRHLGRDGNDSETGHPHLAHACSRVLLALIKMTRPNVQH